MQQTTTQEIELIKTLQECWAMENNGSIAAIWLQESLFGMHDQYTDEEIGDMFGGWAIEHFRTSIAGIGKYN